MNLASQTNDPSDFEQGRTAGSAANHSPDGGATIC